MVLIGCKRTVPYVLIPDRTIDLSEGSPVQMEDIVVGEVNGIQSSNRLPGKQAIHITLDKKYSIPSNSKVRITKSEDADQTILQIIVVASKSYLNPGDTMFFSIPGLTPTKKEETADEPAEGLEYRIQVFASKASHPMNSPIFKGMEDVEEVYDGTLFKYYVGRQSTLAEAKTIRQKIVARGLEDAFIVAFINGERISLDQAIQYEN
jgi:hypothetical protein